MSRGHGKVERAVLDYLADGRAASIADLVGAILPPDAITRWPTTRDPAYRSMASSVRRAVSKLAAAYLVDVRSTASINLHLWCDLYDADPEPAVLPRKRPAGYIDGPNELRVSLRS